MVVSKNKIKLFKKSQIETVTNGMPQMGLCNNFLKIQQCQNTLISVFLK